MNKSISDKLNMTQIANSGLNFARHGDFRLYIKASKAPFTKLSWQFSIKITSAKSYPREKEPILYTFLVLADKDGNYTEVHKKFFHAGQKSGTKLTKHNDEGHLDRLDLGARNDAPGAGPSAVCVLPAPRTRACHKNAKHNNNFN